MQNTTTSKTKLPNTTGRDKFSRGLQLHQSGELNQAEECYREVYRLDPKHTDALHLIGVVALQQGRLDESIETIRQALSLKPDTPEYHANLAAAFRAQGNFDEAITHYQTALQLNPNYSVAHNNLGNTLLDAGQPEQAANSFRRALELSPEMESARENLALAEARLPLITANSHSGNGHHSASEIDSTTKSVLHVGCGVPDPLLLHERFRSDDWREIRLDINPDVQPDILASLTDMSAVETDSMDALWSSHNIEHLYNHDVPVALGEFLRVLKPGGMLFLTLPDLQQIAHFIVADKLDDVAYEAAIGPITTLDCIFGYGKAVAEGNEFMAHKTGFTPKTMTQRLVDAGFHIQKMWTSPFNIWVEAIKP